MKRGVFAFRHRLQTNLLARPFGLYELSYSQCVLFKRTPGVALPVPALAGVEAPSARCVEEAGSTFCRTEASTPHTGFATTNRSAPIWVSTAYAVRSLQGKTMEQKQATVILRRPRPLFVVYRIELGD